MGSTNFSEIQIGKYSNERQAYDDACKEAEEYYGHQEGYNGTISTTSGVKNLTNQAPKYGTQAFRKWEVNMLNDCLEKYGPCIAIEIKGKALVNLKKKNKLVGKKGIKAFYFFGWASC